MGLSRQEHWNGLPFPSPKGTIERKKVIDYTIKYLHMYLPIIYQGKIVLGENGVREKEGRRVDAVFTAEMLPVEDIRRISDCLGDVALLANYGKPGQSHCLR